MPADFVRGMGKFGYAAITQLALTGVEKVMDRFGEAGQGAALGRFFGKFALATVELNWGSELQAAVAKQIQPLFDILADAVNRVIKASGLDRFDAISTESNDESAAKGEGAGEGAGKALADKIL